MTQLRWDNNTGTYACELESGKTLYVDGDIWAEDRMDRVRTYLDERHPGLSVDDLDNPVVEAIWNEASEELSAPTIWEIDAVEMDEYGNPLDPNADKSPAAWIMK